MSKSSYILLYPTILLLPPSLYLYNYKRTYLQPPPAPVFPIHLQTKPDLLKHLSQLHKKSLTHLTHSQQLALVLQAGFKHYAGEPNMRRVTGRKETEKGGGADWGYADPLDETQLDDTVRQIVQKIRDQYQGRELGKLRDVTVNFRED